jgi:hypothetical protein
MINTNQIQTSLVTAEDLARMNQSVYFESTRRGKIGFSYTAPFFYKPEKFYSDNPWEYTINKHGFRGNDWVSNIDVAMFGCSCTFGVGVEEPASEILKYKLHNTRVVNLGMPGSSVVNIIKLFSAFTRLYTVANVFIIIPPIARVFLPDFDTSRGEWGFTSYLPNFQTGDAEKFKQIFNIFSDDVCFSYTADYVEWATEIASNRGITVHWGTWCADTYNQFLTKTTKNCFLWNISGKHARDDGHPGVVAHARLANQCFNLLQAR